MKNVDSELSRAWHKARTFGGTLNLLSPEELNPEFAAEALIRLLEQTYVSHGISQVPLQVEEDIRNGQVEPFIVTRNSRPVACAALVHQTDGSVEIGRAVSIENGTGVGKIAMLSAAERKGTSPLVAEIRLADAFAEVPGSEATQRICHGILGLTIHAVLPPFMHGRHPSSGAKYNEVFGFAAEHVRLNHDSIISTAKNSFVGRRDVNGPLEHMQVIESSPFRVAIPSSCGSSIEDFQRESRFGNPGCTMVALEATDQNLSSLSWLLAHEFVLSGVDRHLGQSGLPVVLLATLAHGSLLAPTKPSDTLPRITRQEVTTISNQFNQLVERG